MSKSNEIPSKLIQSICRVLIGKQDQVTAVVVALLAGGHVLIEDIPGVGKTILALAASSSMGVRFNRIQFTSDTLPSDVIGVNVYDPKTAEFDFKFGPVFTEVLLADEINRTSPRTQSALLEAMAERRVSVDGITHQLADPFFVLATMNPVERFGSFELPESQLDRFMMSIQLGYPDRDHERAILTRDIHHSNAAELEPVTDPETIRALKRRVTEVKVESSLMDYLLDLIHATREHPHIRLGLSSRGGLHLKRAMQASALVKGRDFATPEDLRRIFRPVTIHRLMLAGSLGDGAARENRQEVVEEILRSVKAPL